MATETPPLVTGVGRPATPWSPGSVGDWRWSDGRITDTGMGDARKAIGYIQWFLWGIPVFWLLGVDFLTVQVLTLVLVLFVPAAHRRSTISDHTLAAIALVLGASAYVNGFLLAEESQRFVAALYNLSFWVCGFVIVQQVRHALRLDPHCWTLLLRTGFWAFMIFALVAGGVFAFAYLTLHFR